jgi:hypothetical protein
MRSVIFCIINGIKYSRGLEGICFTGLRSPLVSLTFGLRDRLRFVDFTQCKIGAGYGVLLAEQLLKKASLLEVLILDDNLMGDEGVIALTEGLRGHPNLHTLGLKKCGVGPRGAASLGFLLGACKLCELELSANRLESEGEESIAHGLSKSTTLRSLLVGPALTRNGTALIGKAGINHSVVEKLCFTAGTFLVAQRAVAWRQARQYFINARQDAVGGSPISVKCLRDKITQFAAGTQMGRLVKERMRGATGTPSNAATRDISVDSVRVITKWYWHDFLSTL